MPDYRITYRKNNEPIDGVEQDDTIVSTTMTASTPEKAVEKAFEFALHPSEVEGFEEEIVELDEDGAPV